MNITEIAKLAGVSKTAVSRYFNQGYLSEEKRAAIAAVVEQTGYAPSEQARTLRVRRSRQIGVVMPRLNSESTARVDFCAPDGPDHGALHRCIHGLIHLIASPLLFRTGAFA